jgi:hypothetical protein
METAAQGHQLAHRGGAAWSLPLLIGSKNGACFAARQSGLGAMNAKTTHDLVLLAALSLFCATVAWSEDHAVFASVFLTLTAVVALNAVAQGPGADMDKDYLTLKRANASRPSGQWRHDDYDVICDGAVVGRIMHTPAAPEARPWRWSLAYGYHRDHTPTFGYEATREAAMGAFAKNWRRE